MDAHLGSDFSRQLNNPAHRCRTHYTSVFHEPSETAHLTRAIFLAERIHRMQSWWIMRSLYGQSSLYHRGYALHWKSNVDLFYFGAVHGTQIVQKAGDGLVVYANRERWLWSDRLVRCEECVMHSNWTLCWQISDTTLQKRSRLTDYMSAHACSHKLCTSVLIV